MMQVDGDRIIDLHVDPACWHGGVGSRLLEAGEQQIARSYPAARLEVRSFNTRARAFYAHRGWAEVRRYLDMECGSPVETVELLRTL